MFAFSPVCRSIPVAITVLAALAGTTAGAAQSATVGPLSCPPGVSSIMTLADALVRYDGYYTVEEIHTGFASHDKNGNGYTCYKLLADDRFFPLVNFFYGDDLD